ncbi:hypothetical protein JKY72_02175 [Candidatus Gracilibacteria bacterium]|nr:hypothetical protein [Candidatus Gracilibacteria bacterium]
MSERVYTFGKLYLEIDRMAGLRLSDKNGEYMNLQSWDDKLSPEIGGELLMDDSEVGKEFLLTRKQVGAMFVPFDEGSLVGRSYSRRSGRLGRAKNVGVIRLQTRDAITFELVLCDGGELVLSTLATLEFGEKLDLIANCGGRSMRVRMFDIENERRKIAKICKSLVLA